MNDGGDATGRGSLSPVAVAFLFAGTAALLASATHVGVRIQSQQGLPSAEIVFLRTFFTILLTAPFVFRPGRMAWRTQVPHLHIVRGAIGTLSMWMWYYALSTLPLAEASTLGQTTALFLVLGATLWFREPVGWARGAALAAGFAGALIVLKPGASGISYAAVMALASSALWALSLLMSKRLSRHDSALTITFWQPLTIAPWALLIALPGWVMPRAADLGLMIGLAAAAGLANYCINRALGMADASLTAPLDYTKLLWTTAAAYLLFGEVPAASTWLGGCLIVGASFAIVIYEQRRKSRA